MKIFRSRLFAACVASALTALVVGGIAWAQIPASNGVITGCYVKTGALRVIDSPTATCTKSETQLQWNQQGPRGGTGPQGAPGTASASCSAFPHPGVDWSGCDFRHAFLSGQNFTNANLSNTDLQGVAFSDVVITGANLSGADLSPYPDPVFDDREAGIFSAHAEGANFTGANLTGAILSDDLNQWTGANFTNANFTNAELGRGAGFSTATFTGATWSHTRCPDLTLSDQNGTNPESCIGHL